MDILDPRLEEYVERLTSPHDALLAELSEETRTFARMCLSMIEEAEAIDWYEQRLSVEKDPEARAIMENAQQEEFKHFAMDLEFLLRRKPKWRVACKKVLFQAGDIVEPGTIVDLRYTGDEDLLTYLVGSIEERNEKYSILSTNSPIGKKWHSTGFR